MIPGTNFNQLPRMKPPTESTDNLHAESSSDATTRFRRAQWGILFALMFCYLFYYMGRQNFGWALTAMNRDLGLTMEQLGYISMSMLMMYGVGQFINGNLGDKFGGRKMMTMGGLLSCGFNWLTSFGNSFSWIFASWGANGYAQSMGWAPGSRILSNWWPHEKRGKAFGWYVFSAGCSSVLIAILGATFAARHLSWEWVFRIPVLFLAVACIVFYIVARNKPEDRDFPPIPEEPEEGKPASPRVEETSLQRYGMVVRNWRFLLGSLSIGFESLARYGLIIWLPVHLTGPAYEEQSFAVFMGIALPIGMAIGALSTGYISDKLFASNRSRPIALLMTLATAVLLLIYLMPPERFVLVTILIFCAGFLVYGPQSCYWALCPDLLGRYRAATAIGVMNMWAYFVAAVTDPMIGRLIDQHGSTPVFLLLSVSCALGALVILPIRR